MSGVRSNNWNNLLSFPNKNLFHKAPKRGFPSFHCDGMFNPSSRIQAVTLLCMRCLKAVLKVL